VDAVYVMIKKYIKDSNKLAIGLRRS